MFLTTKPDGATGSTGTNVVNVIKLQLDVNHDSTMDTSFAGPDNTSANRPFRFWLNDDCDRTILSYSGVLHGSDINNPGQPDYDNFYINSTRDLEDYARLWIVGIPALPATNGYLVTLSWTNVARGTPVIKLFTSVETNGGTGYLTDTNIAAAQVHHDLTTTNNPGISIGSVAPGQPFSFSAGDFVTNSTKYLLFEGAGFRNDDGTFNNSGGQGELVLTVSQNGTNIASTSAFIDLHDIKDFYERAHVENVTPALPPSSLISRMALDNTLPADSTETQQMIVFAHGMNQTQWEYENSSETMFKRLYWSGYHGRFAAFRWPCGYLPPTDLSLFSYDVSEFYSWKSGTAFKDYMTYLSDNPNLAGYSLNIIAHSQGNIMASEALEQGAPFDNYILTQAAAPAHSYDTDTNDVPFLQPLLDAETTTGPTPLEAIYGGYGGYFTNLSGNLINFFNTNDFALESGVTLGIPTNYEEDQRTRKPETLSSSTHYYVYYDDNHVSADYLLSASNTVSDLQEVKAMVARSRSHAIGAQSGAQGAISLTNSVDLKNSFQFDNTRPDHSAQFTRPIQTALPYYQQVLRSFSILP